jgi:hypothetical protein
MQPKFAFVPPEQTPVSQVPDWAQSVSAQHAVLAACPPPLRHRPVSFMQVPPAPHVLVGDTAHAPPQAAPGVDPPTHRLGSRVSPVRLRPEVSGRLRFVVTPVLQSAVPAAFADTVLMTHVLVAAPLCEPFGIGSGGPKRQPAFVQSRLLPACADEVPVRVSVVPVQLVLTSDFP